MTRERKELEEAIKKNGETGVTFDRYYVVGYDPPFKLFGRRNEIWYVKATEKREEKTELIEDVKETEAKEESENPPAVNGETEAKE